MSKPVLSSSRVLSIVGASLLVGALGSSCSATKSSSGFTGAGGAGGSGSGQGAGTSDSSSDVGNFVTSGSTMSNTGSTGTGEGGGCAGDVTTAQQLPLDIFIMLDQSGSMLDTVAGGGTKWDAVTAALKAFVTQPGLGGISVGIQYFGLPPGGSMTCGTTCATDADCGPATCGPCFFGICLGGGAAGDSCDANDYAKADVEIAPLPGVAPAIINSINAHSPTTSTPTSAALAGAIQHAKDWATQHPNHVVIDIFATDGDPSECDLDQNNINAIAAAGYNGMPKISTFVIGVGSSLTALNGIAAAGGTGQAFIVDTTQNVNQQFIMALNAIRGAALGCNYKIPVPSVGQPDYSKVNVEYTPGGSSTPQIIPQVAGKGQCPSNGDAWYYDDPNNPTQILLCDATCNKLSADNMGTVSVVLGCKTIIK
jgi:hypothetical protein